MLMKVLLYECPGRYFDVARTTLLQHDTTDPVCIVQVTKKAEFHSELQREDFAVVLVVADGLDWDWAEALRHVNVAAAHLPLIIILNSDDSAERACAHLSGAWHTVPPERTDLLRAAMNLSLRHAGSLREAKRSHDA